MSKSLKNQVWDKICDQIDYKISGQVSNQVWDNAESKLWCPTKVWEKIWYKVYRKVRLDAKFKKSGFFKNY